MKGTAKCYDKLREFIANTPIVDCHDHTEECGPNDADAIHVILGGYFNSDAMSASSDETIATLRNTALSLEERWPLMEEMWNRTRHTGYAQVSRLIMKKFYEEDELTLDALKRMNERILNLEDEKVFDGILEEAKIVARLEHIEYGNKSVSKIMDGTLKQTPRGRFIIPLRQYHSACHSSNDIRANVAPMGRQVTSLAEYVEACREMFAAYQKLGAVAMKDNSAYNRPINYGNPTYAEAEECFNWLMADQRRETGQDQNKALSDYLFNEFMRCAREMDLPVQIHTGHMAGIRNNLDKTNAKLLQPMLELHRDVQFDLFHANWPYAGDLLFLAKNYPNVSIDFCWAHIIDPIYCQNMLKQVISSVPHGKIHGYGSDFLGRSDRAWAHAEIARDNIAIALSDLVEIDYFDLDTAKEIAQGWLFDYPNKFFKLNLS